MASSCSGFVNATKIQEKFLFKDKKKKLSVKKIESFVLIEDNDPVYNNTNNKNEK